MPSTKDISEAILEYLYSHPEASDTLMGIAEWWLFDRAINHEVKTVRAALSKLLKDNWIIEIKSNNSEARYRLNPAKHRKINTKA